MSMTNPKLNYRELSPLAFLELEETPLLLDVRSQFEFELFHAPQAVNLSLQRLLLRDINFLAWNLPPWFRSLPLERPIAVICLTSHRSPIAAQHLSKKGYHQIYNIEGGMTHWQQMGLPVVRKSK